MVATMVRWYLQCNLQGNRTISGFSGWLQPLLAVSTTKSNHYRTGSRSGVSRRKTAKTPGAFGFGPLNPKKKTRGNPNKPKKPRENQQKPARPRFEVSQLPKQPEIAPFSQQREAGRPPPPRFDTWLWVKTHKTPGEHQSRWYMGAHPPQDGSA